MYQYKRSLELSGISTVETKKRRTTPDKENYRITCLEQLANELFYEIFEYLSGCDIYKAFSNLNSRFQQLLTGSSLPLKIELPSEVTSELEHYCRKFIVPNRHKILSLHFHNEWLVEKFLTYCMIDSTLVRLESIVLGSISCDELVILLFHLKSLPRLFSLNASFDVEWGHNLSSIYRMIFSLPALKYNKMSCPSDSDEELNISIPLAINERFSTIEHLTIDHHCTLAELFTMLQHTPKLRHLFCDHLIESDTFIDTRTLLTLPNLTCLEVRNCQLSFDEFEMLISKISFQLQVLNVRQIMGEEYLDADRWERLIKKYIPHLRRFRYEYYQPRFAEDEDDPLHVNFNRFNSPFWMRRQYFCGINHSDEEVIYSIQSCPSNDRDIYKHPEVATYFNGDIAHGCSHRSSMRNRQEFKQSPTRCDLPIQLSISWIPSDEQNQVFIDRYKSMFTDVPFTRLNMNCNEMSTEMLVRILQLLPNLDTLKLSSLPFIPQNWLFEDDGEIRFLTSISNKITKVILQKTKDIEQVHFLLYLCLCIQYLQVDVPENMDLEMLLRFILTKSSIYVPHLKSLHLCVPNANEDMTSQLQNLIESEKLLSNYTIQCFRDNILLKWN